jgi:hypothetical protein
MYYIEHISYSITTIAGKAWYDISQSKISTFMVWWLCEILRIVKCLSEADLE